MATSPPVVAASAWARRESRGAQYRIDYPAERPELARRNAADACRGARDRGLAVRARRAARTATDDRLNTETDIIVTTPASLLHPDAFLSPLAIDEAVQRALDEDLGRAGDITSFATIPETPPPAPSWWRGRPA